MIMAVYNIREDWLRQAVESVLAQTYPNWELICVNDASPAPHVKRALDELASRDSRMVVIHSERNLGVAVATNRGLSVAKGTTSSSWITTTSSNRMPCSGSPRPSFKTGPT